MSAPSEMSRGRFLQLTAGALALTACSEHVEVTDPGDGTVVEVIVRASTFAPSQLTIPRGTTVRWRTQTTDFHTITPDGHTAWTEKQVQGNNLTFDVTFHTAGTFPYYCVPHRSIGMTGRIVVE